MRWFATVHVNHRTLNLESIILDTYVLWPYTGAMILDLSHGEYREMPQKPLFQIFMPMKSTMLVCVREHWLSKIVVYKI